MNGLISNTMPAVLFAAALASATPAAALMVLDDVNGSYTDQGILHPFSGTLSVNGIQVINVDIDAGAFGNFTYIAEQAVFGGSISGSYLIVLENNSYFLSLSIDDPLGFVEGIPFSAITRGSFHSDSATFGEPITGTITNATLTAPVPEPHTWAMLILGFAVIGFMGYRRRESAGPAPKSG